MLDYYNELYIATLLLHIPCHRQQPSLKRVRGYWIYYNSLHRPTVYNILRLFPHFQTSLKSLDVNVNLVCYIYLRHVTETCRGNF